MSVEAVKSVDNGLNSTLGNFSGNFNLGKQVVFISYYRSYLSNYIYEVFISTHCERIHILLLI